MCILSLCLIYNSVGVKKNNRLYNLQIFLGKKFIKKENTKNTRAT